MQSTKMLCATVALFICLLSIGCASGPKLPKYVEPDLPASQVAILEGHGGVYVTVIDGQKAPRSSIVIQQGWGGNKVKLLPGPHSITAYRELGTYTIGKTSYSYHHNFEAGHTYRLDGDGWLTHKIKMIDETTKQVIPPQAAAQKFEQNLAAPVRP